LIDVDTEPTAAPNYHLDRASARTPEEREAAFQRYMELSAPYFAKVEAEGDQPWWTTEDERRELFFKRWTRPASPAGMPRMSLAEIRGEHRRWIPVIPIIERNSAA
jgi:hypothetical protein